jgi:formylmethanofuran dehydrogenase subunit E
MKKKQTNINPSHTYNNSKKCSHCGVVSKDVNMSVILNQLLCLDCLKDKILGRL